MKKIISIVTLLLFISGTISPFTFSLVEVLGLLKKISTNITTYSDYMDEYYEKFTEFYQTKWVKYYSKFSVEESDILNVEETDSVYSGQKTDPGDMERKWKKIFSDPEKLKEEFPNIFQTSHYKQNPEYLSDPVFKKKTDENIQDGVEYLRNIGSIITLMRNTRESQKMRGNKVAEMKQYIRNFALPRGKKEVRMGRLIALEVIIDHEIEKQFAELITLMNAETEIMIRSSSMAENFRNRNFRSRITKKGKSLERRNE